MDEITLSPALIEKAQELHRLCREVGDSKDKAYDKRAAVSAIIMGIVGSEAELAIYAEERKNPHTDPDDDDDDDGWL